MQYIVKEERGVYESCALVGISYPTLWRWRQRAMQGEKGLFRTLNKIFTYLENRQAEALRLKQAEVLQRISGRH